MSHSGNHAPGDKWTKFKMDCAQEVGQLQYCSENNTEYKGDVPAKINGAQGGPIGGQMVKKMIEFAERQNGLNG